jgi:hypothetical protein
MLSDVFDEKPITYTTKNCGETGMFLPEGLLAVTMYFAMRASASCRARLPDAAALTMGRRGS